VLPILITPPQPKSAGRMGGFLMSIAGTMQNWNDNTQARSAGVRDRVVRVRLEKNEGGMNLNMPNEVIGSDGWNGWSAQRWVRLAEGAGTRSTPFKFV
jgi:hypothetical protein